MVGKKRHPRVREQGEDYTTWRHPGGKLRERGPRSLSTEELLAVLISTGTRGKCDIHKKVWELSILQYKEEKQQHRELAELGIKCTQRVKQALPTLDTKGITPGKIGRLRNQVREVLKRELTEIDGIVQEIMKR